MIKIYSIHYIKPEFVELQYHQFKKNCNDEYELIIVNNAFDDNTKNSIIDICKKFNINSIKITDNNSEKFTSQSHFFALEYILQNYIKIDDTNNISVILDCDVFPFKKFSFIDILNGKKICGLYQQRNINNTSYEYLSAIFTIFHNDIDLSNFTFNGIADTGSGTNILMKKYSTELVIHTAAIDIESDYIFTNNKLEYPYKQEYRCQFISNEFIHYYRGSNWSESDENYHNKKNLFLLNFINNYNIYKLNLDDVVLYDTAHSDKGLNGVDHNYNNYRYIEKMKNEK